LDYKKKVDAGVAPGFSYQEKTITVPAKIRGRKRRMGNLVSLLH
jgi:hypothetical protein